MCKFQRNAHKLTSGFMLSLYLICWSLHIDNLQGRIVQSAAPPTQESEFMGSISSLATYFCFSFTLIKEVVSFWQKNVHLILVNGLGGLSLPGASVVRLTDHFDMTIAVYCGWKATKQQHIDKIHQIKIHFL